MDYQLYVIKQRQLEKRKRELANTQTADNVHQANNALFSQSVINSNPVVIPKDTSGLYGDYGDLQTLLQAVDEANVKRRSHKTRAVENRLAYEQFLPVMRAWLDNKVILDIKFFAYFSYYAVDEKDYLLLIEMADLSIELKVIDFKPHLKRLFQSFIIDEFYTSYHKKHHLLQPDGKGTFKSLRLAYPDWFWTIYHKAVETKEWWTVQWQEQTWLMGLAVLAHNHAKEYKKAVSVYESMMLIRSDNGVTDKSSGSGYKQEYEYALAHLQATST